MPKRFTDTEKWLKKWHRELPPEKKLFFDYLCDRCDIAGCLDIDPARVAGAGGEMTTITLREAKCRQKYLKNSCASGECGV